MKKFIVQGLIFLSCFLLIVIAVFYTAEGHADGLYLKFTTPRQSSMILGTSKAAQGLQPTILNEALERDDIYNYAFTVVHSPYGPAYLRSIKNKLKQTGTDGVFIVTVDPHSIASRTQDPNDTVNFRENRSAVGEIENVTSFPNFRYLAMHYPEPYIYLLTRRIEYVSQGFLHDDGWVETNLSMDPESVKKRTAEKIESYSDQIKQYKFSDVRLEYLEKTINYLKKHGEVYLVRLPVVKPLLKLENSIVPDFDEQIKIISERNNIPYLDLTSRAESYDYDDGNHLNKESGKIVSEEIAAWIKSFSKPQIDISM